MQKFGKYFWDNKTFATSADSDQPAHLPVRGRYNFTQTVLYGGKMSPGILRLPLIQEGQLSVSGERMCTILVNRLED